MPLDAAGGFKVDGGGAGHEAAVVVRVDGFEVEQDAEVRGRGRQKLGVQAVGYTISVHHCRRRRMRGVTEAMGWVRSAPRGGGGRLRAAMRP